MEDNITLTKNEIKVILDIMDEIDEFTEIQNDVWVKLYKFLDIE